MSHTSPGRSPSLCLMCSVISRTQSVTNYDLMFGFVCAGYDEKLIQRESVTRGTQDMADVLHARHPTFPPFPHPHCYLVHWVQRVMSAELQHCYFLQHYTTAATETPSAVINPHTQQPNTVCCSEQALGGCSTSKHCNTSLSV